MDRGRCNISAARLDRLSHKSAGQGQEGEEDGFMHAPCLSRKASPRKKRLGFDDDGIAA